jgi:hypothetical protein
MLEEAGANTHTAASPAAIDRLVGTVSPGRPGHTIPIRCRCLPLA